MDSNKRNAGRFKETYDKDVNKRQEQTQKEEDEMKRIKKTRQVIKNREGRNNVIQNNKDNEIRLRTKTINEC